MSLAPHRLNPGRLIPRSLVGQMAALVGLALFVAQAINFGLLLRERAVLRIEQTTGPAAARIADGLERESAGRPIPNRRGWLRRSDTNPIDPAAQHRPEIVRELREKLRHAGIEPGRIEAAVHRLPRQRQERMNRRRIGPPSTRELIIAVEQPGRGWLVLLTPWPDPEPWLLWRLIAQTLVLYVAVLLPVIWVARRISRPLAALASAAEGFQPGTATRVEEDGPPDIRAVIAAYNALQLRVTAMLTEKDRMLGAIGHDLRTPLAALRVRVESVEDDEDRTRMADTIDEMNRTLDDILSLARLGRPSEPETDVDIAALVDAVVEDFRELGQPVTFVEAPRTPIRLRPTLMRRAVRNLIENAVKYGGGATVSIDATPARLAILVCDEGPGIPPGKLAEVFDPFTRLETSRNRETGGSGLGLALARAIARDAGGEIALANRPTGGLEAMITLPR